MEHRFFFYQDGKIVATRKFFANTVEEAYKMADNTLRKVPRYDDWEYIKAEKEEDKNNGTQRSPFGIGS